MNRGCEGPQPSSTLTESWFTSLLVCMKATIEFDDELYRQVKAAAAIRGRKVKDLVAEGPRIVLRSSHSALPARRIQLPIVKSKKPGTLRLGNEMIAEVEARLDTGTFLSRQTLKYSIAYPNTDYHGLTPCGFRRLVEG